MFQGYSVILSYLIPILFLFQDANNEKENISQMNPNDRFLININLKMQFLGAQKGYPPWVLPPHK